MKIRKRPNLRCIFEKRVTPGQCNDDGHDNDDVDDGDDGDKAHNCGQVIWETADLPVNLCLPPQNLLWLTWTEYKEKQTTYIYLYIIYSISYK